MRYGQKICPPGTAQNIYSTFYDGDYEFHECDYSPYSPGGFMSCNSCNEAANIISICISYQKKDIEDLLYYFGFEIMLFNKVNGDYYVCQTCKNKKSDGPLEMCPSCAKICHANHNLVKKNGEYICRCGESKIPYSCCHFH